ncbi:hypothetical protein CKO28_18890 [Rhodovibrio sodomensis]|uniref:Uncharacterized protein n=1 Tax=Rhodovibrio sodomensis TaxID=1088 RepID=A0ABS1DJC6_9PROT|nr:hypothetical protein [Rhodovibrio sodomensis]MBK1670106.1 hypothetical protein [Rhodovibrio sodomensis]
MTIANEIDQYRQPNGELPFLIEYLDADGRIAGDEVGEWPEQIKEKVAEAREEGMGVRIRLVRRGERLDPNAWEGGYDLYIADVANGADYWTFADWDDPYRFLGHKLSWFREDLEDRMDEHGFAPRALMDDFFAGNLGCDVRLHRVEPFLEIDPERVGEIPDEWKVNWPKCG